MLNPFLERTLYSLPIQPVLVEVDLDQVNRVLGNLLGMNLRLPTVIPTFGFIAVSPVRPSIIRAINALPGVRMVHADLVKNVFELPSPDWFPTSESRKMLEAEAAFREGYTGEMVRVGVTDTGIDPTHPQLVGQSWYSTIAWPVREVLDENGHGSHCASTVAGKIYYTPIGVAVEGVSRSPLISVKCLGRGIGTGFTSEIINAMALCYDKGAQVISMSLGSQECQGGCEICPECRMVSHLTQRGVIFAIAAGNSGPAANTIGCPGCSPSAITVAAVDKKGIVADFSSRGGSKFPGKPDCAAPGVNIYSGTSRGSLIDVQEALAGPGFAAISGTSMATPHISGFMALLKSKYSNMSAALFKEKMAARGHSHNHISGYGVPRWNNF